MGVPLTTGQLRSNIVDMKIGDYIVWRSDGLKYHMDDQTDGTERPVIGATSIALPYANTYWYGIKVDKGLIISDRVVEHTVSWDTLNNSKRIQGISIELADGTRGTMRSLTGGVSFTDEKGGSSMTDKLLGGFPINNEWDRYIMNFPTNKIQSGKTLDDVFHVDRNANPNIPYTLTQETPILGFVSINNVVATNVHRIARVKFSSSFVSHLASSTSGNYAGFRPVFEYIE